MKKIAIGILSIIIVAILWLIGWALDFDPERIAIFYWLLAASLFVAWTVNWCLNEIFD